MAQILELQKCCEEKAQAFNNAQQRSETETRNVRDELKQEKNEGPENSPNHET